MKTNNNDKLVTEKKRIEKKEILERLAKKFADPIGITEKELEDERKKNK